MKRDPIEFIITLACFCFSLLFIFLLLTCTFDEERCIFGVLILQTLGVILTLTSGIFDKRK